VLLGGHFDDLCHLVLTLGHELLDVGDNLLNNVCAALDLNGVAVRVLLGELDRPCEFSAVVRASSLDDDVTDI
jgi:hypothetical protein